VSAEPHEIVVINHTKSQLKITVESRKDQSIEFTTSGNGSLKDSITVPVGEGEFLGPGTNTKEASGGIFVSTDETGTVTETIEFDASSKSESVNIQAFQEISLTNDPGLIAGCSNAGKSNTFPKGNKNTRNGNTIRNGSVRFRPDTTAKKKIDASDCVILGEESIAKDKVFAGNNVILQSGAEIKGKVGSSDTPIGGSLKLKDGSVIQDDVFVEGEIINDGGTIHGKVNPNRE
jgi:hypothetical protein